ncbi:hypothetical protein CR513_52183, partial [Mucuna pruriens]
MAPNEKSWERLLSLSMSAQLCSTSSSRLWIFAWLTLPPRKALDSHGRDAPSPSLENLASLEGMAFRVMIKEGYQPSRGLGPPTKWYTNPTWLVAKIDPIKYVFEKPSLTG